MSNTKVQELEEKAQAAREHAHAMFLIAEELHEKGASKALILKAYAEAAKADRLAARAHLDWVEATLG